MFKSKADVDRHVRELFRKVTDEKERNLRCYNIAKLYYQVGDYEAARRYVSSYLEVKGDSSGAHKLLGQILEALGQKEAALAQYKQSLELESRQDDLVLKVCELLADMDIGLDVNRVKYWVDRANEKFAHNPVVFQLKEKMLMTDRPNGTDGDLEGLIASELSARPSDVNLRVKLLKHYLSRNRLDDAYKHALEVESTFAHRDSLVWYETLCDVLTKFKEQRQPKSSFWIPYIASLERYTALTLRERHGGSVVKTVEDAASAVFNFDQALTVAKLQNLQVNASFIDQMFNHMFGQLNYHFACLLIRRTKREQGSWNETGRLCSPLLLTAIHSSPIDPNSPSIMSLKDQSKPQALIWHREGAYRISQASHVLQDYAREDSKRFLEKVDKFCVGAWRERIYQRIFTANPHIAMMTKSYFANNNSSPPPLRLLPHSEMKKWDDVSEEVNPSSLHHHVWLGLANKPHSRRNIELNEPYPNQICHVFSDLQQSAYNLNQAAPDSLGRLDIDAFLNATILCSSVIVEEQQKSGFLNRDRMPTLPADTTNPLSTANQDKWWTSAYKMYKKPETIGGNLMELRQELQRGLEVIRCIGNHGLHPTIIVHLARIFHHRAKELQSKEKAHADLSMLEARYEMYWEIAVPLLERLINNQTIRSTNSKLFDYQGREMSNLELSNALEEGRLVLSRKLLREKQYEQAIDALQSLKCPEASYLQAEVYKTLADELIGSLAKENLTSAIRSQHVVLLSKARNCYYLTLDRLRSPGVNPNHPLNSELGSKISSIENDLKRIDPDLHRNDSHRNNCDALSDESYSSAQSGGEQPTLNSLNHGATINTPQRQSHRTPKQSSTPRHPHHQQDVLEHSRSRIQLEARPSPERLDAQIRQLVYAKDHVFQTILEQNKSLLESNKTLVESNKLMREMLEELRREFADFRKETQQKRSTRSVSASQNIEEDYPYAIEDDYSDMNYTQPVGNTTVTNAPPAPAVGTPHQLPGNLFANQRHPFSPLVYPTPPGALPGYYQGGLPFSDPQAHPIPPLYSPSVYQMPLYPRAGTVDQSLGGMQPGMFQQGLFTNRLMDLVPPQANPQSAQLNMQMQNLDLSRSELPAPAPVIGTTQPPPPTPFMGIKDAPVIKAPPTNVVITTSDTLPTTAPPVQPTLSVTIPPHHRNVGNAGLANTSVVASNIPANVPHNYQISMPSHATIPTTVNLPPLATSVTNTIAAVSEKSAKNNSVLSTGSHNSSIEAVEVEHDPIPDFQPVIPLPAEVKVTTGEEDEETLFVARAKLFRFVDKEWKDRGVGNVKLLKNKEGKVRLLMRREQVLKICANHMLTPEMELSAMPNNDKAWIWVANDFADEEVKLEKLCIKFKTAEEAQDFKKSFDEAKTTMTLSPTKPSSKTVEIKRAETKQNEAPKTMPVVVGGFSFTKPPLIQQPVSTERSQTEKTAEPVPKPSPFAGFSFTKTDTSATTPAGLTLFGKPADNKSPPFTTSTSTPAKIKEVNAESLTELTGPINEENEAVLFDKPAVIMRSTAEGQWKERGSGPVNLLLDSATGKLRLLMRKSENAKVCCDQALNSTTVFSTISGSANILTWVSQETSKTGKPETFAVSLPCINDTNRLKDIISSLQKLMSNDKIPLANITKVNSKTVRVSLQAKPSQPSLAEMFKPAAGSWECTACYIRNDGSATNCISCSTPSGRAVEKPQPKSNANTSVPLSELFKPPADSWECTACYTRNTKSNQYCVSCDAPSDPSLLPKPAQPSGFGLATSTSAPSTFTFGMPPVKDAAAPSVTSSFQFGTGSSGFSFKAPGADDKSTTENKSGFPSFQSKPPTTDFVFGIPTQKLDVPPPKNSFTFGSPGKQFDFQFSSKSPGKSPGGPGDVSEDEVAESEDVYFAPVVPLPDKIEVKTGEEDEQILYAHRAKLFRFDANTKEWKERGLGDIKLLKHKGNGKLRLVMRREQTLKLCLNHGVPLDLEITPKDEKTWLWNAADYSDGEIEYVQLACRFKNSDIAEQFKKAVEDGIDESRKTEGKDDKSQRTSKSSSVGSAHDIQVIYELKVTEEEKNAALKLQLPENFYAYRQKEDCPGCLGCKEPDVPLFDQTGNNKTEVPQGGSTTPVAVKLAPPKLTPPANQPIATANTTKASIFGGGVQTTLFNSTATTTFGTQPTFGNSNLQNDKPEEKKAGFVFGVPQKTDTDVAKNLFGGNVSICSPAEPKTQSSTVNFGTSTFGQQPSSIFGGQPSIFSGTAQTKSIFGGKSDVPASTGFSGFGAKPALGSTTAAPVFGSSTSTPGFGSAASTVFGSVATDSPSSFANLSGSGSIFGGNANSSASAKNDTPATNKLFGSEVASPFGSKLTFGSLTSNTNASPVGSTLFGTPKPDFEADNKKEETPNFLKAENAVSFGALAAKTSETAFKKDPNFSFAGAGQSVFGGSRVSNASVAPSNANNSISSDATQKTSASKKTEDDEAGEEEGENDGQDYDPHFEPIVPLPDQIEVRTGEEEEEKVFCHRAKLYRYESETKEWKERGTGEMKLLHHAGHGTYRLLLRREQVHKVVCNFLVTPDLELRTLNTSDRAWMWAGMNFAEEPAAVEELAVRFKSPELAAQFKDAVDKAIEDLSTRIHTITLDPNQIIGEEGDAEDECEEDEDIHSLMYEREATLMFYDEENPEWKDIGLGQVKIIYDSEIFGARIIFETMPGHVVCSTIISMETEMEIQGDCCLWTAIDDAFDPATRRSFKLQFPSEQDAQDFLMNFRDGQECARQAGISETAYYEDNDDDDEE